MARKDWVFSGPYSLPVRVSLRILQLIFALTTIGIFGADLHSASPPTNYIYALVVGVLAFLTDIYHCLATGINVAWYFWDFILCVLWAALAGVAGQLLFANDGSVPESQKLHGPRQDRMLGGLGIALLNMLLWLLSAVHGCMWWFSARRQKKAGNVAKQDMIEHGDESDEFPMRNSKAQGY